MLLVSRNFTNQFRRVAVLIGRSMKMYYLLLLYTTDVTRIAAPCAFPRMRGNFRVPNQFIARELRLRSIHYYVFPSYLCPHSWQQCLQSRVDSNFLCFSTSPELRAELIWWIVLQVLVSYGLQLMSSVLLHCTSLRLVFQLCSLPSLLLFPYFPSELPSNPFLSVCYGTTALRTCNLWSSQHLIVATSSECGAAPCLHR